MLQKDLNEVTVNILCKLYLDDFTFELGNIKINDQGIVQKVKISSVFVVELWLPSSLAHL